MRNPRATDIFQAQSLGIARHAFHIITKLLVTKMAAHRLEATRVELRLERFRRDFIGAGQFHIFDAPIFYFVERAGHVLVELRAQTVELKADRAFEIRPGAGRTSGQSGGKNERQ